MRAARWSATHPWRALGAWLAFVIVAVSLAMLVPTAETTDADYRQGESGRADAMMSDAGLVDVDSENVLITSDSADKPDRAEATQAAQDLTALIRDTDGVAEISEPQWSPDGSAMLIAIQFAKDQDDVRTCSRTPSRSRPTTRPSRSGRSATSASTRPSTSASARTSLQPRASASPSP